MSISTITSTITAPGAGSVSTATGAVAPVAPITGNPPLKPAVQFSIRGGKPDDQAGTSEAATAQNEARIRIDADTRTIVYQEVDPASGDIVIQLPDPVVLKARAYADRAAAQAATEQRAATSATFDRTA